MTDELIEEGRLEKVSLFGYRWLFGEHHVLSCSWVGGEKSPVDVAAVPQVRVVTILRCEAQDVLNEFLCVCRTLKEELDDGGKKLKLNLSVFIVKVLEEGSEKFVYVVDTVTVFTKDPNHGCPISVITCKRERG